MEKTSLSYIIATLRKELDLSLEDIARKTGLHRTTIGLIERGEREPTVETASKIAEAMNKPLVELLLLQEKQDTYSIKKRGVKEDCIINVNKLQSIDLTSETILSAIQHLYSTLDVIDEQLLKNGGKRLSELVELANLSSIVGNILGAGLAKSSNNTYIRNRPHAYPDLIRENGEGNGVEIKIALERNMPKGHLSKGKFGYYLTFRYVLTDESGNFDKKNRGDTVSIWEVKCDYLEEEDFSESNTDGDSGKTATIRNKVHNKMSLVYFDPSIVPYSHSEKKPYVGFN
ncbi:helix-turn-helix domain-containing protein [Alkalicoccus chagannorensis]|uniref:helix-turn-helix domain-containing protein n=1 Tax=Alkalicoccus chagannorensis TaxID=427072 RepID=UPI0003F5BCA3|nr:helix-turn-helix transcriptional regulator [Alkalicoccus chagannorensis]